MEPQSGLPEPCSGAAPESQPSGLRHPEAVGPPGRHQGALDSDPQVGRLEPTWLRGVQTGPKVRELGWDALHWQSASFVESHFYWVYKQPFRKTERLCVRTGRDLGGKGVRTAVLQIGTLATRGNHVPRDTRQSESALDPAPGSVQLSSKVQLAPDAEITCHEEPQTTPQTLALPFFPLWER